MQRPRILHIFSRYGDVGGEEVCFRAITEELRAVADVTPFVYSTAELFQSPHGALTKMRYMLRNRDVEEKLRECLRRDRYDAWIIHNTFPAMSPCVYGLALKQSVPVIHYLHNYRAGCLNGVFYRDGFPCFSCKNGNYLPGVLHACWRGSAAYSALAAATLYKTRRMGTWNRLSSYIAVSRRQRELLIQTGIPEDKIRVIPHFIRQKTTPRRDVLYAGRLTQEKGVLPLVQAWERLAPPGRAAYSALAAATLYKTRRMGTWNRLSSYIAVSRRQRELLIQTGIPEDKIRVIPHFIRQKTTPRRDVLYAGRLTQEKGVLPLVQAWERLAPPGRTLYLMGDGPLRGELERYVAFRRLESIRLTGFIPHEEQGAVRAACGLAVAPSLWEETFGMVVLESWLHGTPVIVTPRGGLPELISHGRNGWIAREPSADALAETLHTALEEEERWPSMGAHGQQLLSSTYSPAAWLQSMGSLLEELRLFRQSPNITAS